jgi:hypothetical protein
MIKRLDKIDATPVQDMKAIEVGFLNDTLKQLVHNNETKNRLILDGIARELAKTLNGAVAELENVRDNSLDESGKPATEQNITPHGALTKFIAEVAGNQNHKLETLVDTASGGQMGFAYEVFVEGISDGRTKADAYQNRVRTAFLNAMNEHSVQGGIRVGVKAFGWRCDRQGTHA